MMYYFYNLLDKYPKSEKNGLVSEIKNNLYLGLVCIINAYKSFDKKSMYLNELDVHLKVLKVWDVRLDCMRKELCFMMILFLGVAKYSDSYVLVKEFFEMIG